MRVSTNGELETPNILKSNLGSLGGEGSVVPPEYMEASFFDPEVLSFRPLKYPNIDFIQSQFQSPLE